VRRKGGLQMAVITISRQLGSLGTEIAQGTAEKLAYEYVDKKKIEQALSNYGVPAAEMEKFDERKPSLWDSFLLQKKRFLHSLEAVIYDWAKKGNVVLVGRGGQVLLKNLPGVLHVRIIAPFGVRLKRILAAEGGDEKKASRILSQSDHDSAGFLRSFFEVDWEDQTLYDLLISTEKFSMETAVNLICEAVSSPEIRKGEKTSRDELSNLALTQKVKVILMGILATGFGNVSVLVKGGVVNLSGQIVSEILRDDVLQAVKQIEGVKEVDCQCFISLPYYGP
jgi:cytidylate kinase